MEARPHVAGVYPPQSLAVFWRSVVLFSVITRWKTDRGSIRGREGYPVPKRTSCVPLLHDRRGSMVPGSMYCAVLAQFTRDLMERVLLSSRVASSLSENSLSGTWNS